MKRWIGDGKGYAVLYEPNKITKFISMGNVVDPAAMTSTAWSVTETIPNPLGVVPVVPIVNRGRLLDVDGVMETDDGMDSAGRRFGNGARRLDDDK